MHIFFQNSDQKSCDTLGKLLPINDALIFSELISSITDIFTVLLPNNTDLFRIRI